LWLGYQLAIVNEKNFKIHVNPLRHPRFGGAGMFSKVFASFSLSAQGMLLNINVDGTQNRSVPRFATLVPNNERFKLKVCQKIEF
jgi:hypothetical protein